VFKNSTYNHLIWSIFTVATVVMLTSCGHSTSQEESRYTRSVDIVVSSDSDMLGNKMEPNASGDDTADLSNTDDTDSWLYRVSDPERYRDTPYKPREYDFSISFKDNLLVVDYGQQTVNVYKARYTDVPETPASETWQFKNYDCPGLIDTCQGFGILKKNKVINNFYNVREISLSEIDGAESLAQSLGIDGNSGILCWTYDTGGITGVKEKIQFVPLSAQYIDNLPIRREKNYSPVYEWSDEIPLSRYTDFDNNSDWTGCFIDSSETNFLYVRMQKFEVESPVYEDLTVFPAEECLSEIKNAIIYNNFSHRKKATDPNKMELYTVWETDVVVYCMELAYTVLDPMPLENRGTDPTHYTHELTIVPVWNVYYTATNSKKSDENIVYDGMVMLNAVTGKSIYSEMYGPEENDYLYPHAKDLG